MIADIESGICVGCNGPLSKGNTTFLMPSDKKGTAWEKLTNNSEIPIALSKVTIKSHRIADENPNDTPELDYEIIEVLGKGGMGIVYKARQKSLDRTIALKMLGKSSPENKNLRGKFLIEAVVTGDLDHPNIVPIYDVGETESGILFYAMKHVKGVPWKVVMEKNNVNDNLEILLSVCDAIAFAHSRGIIHRDIKSENVMLGDYGEVLLMDWGMAISIDERGKAESLSSSNSIGGTPAYMPPEMVKGDLSSIGIGSDIYLLGAVLYEVINGKPPHRGETVSKFLKSAEKNEIIPSDSPSELMDISLKAMATHHLDRYQDVREFQDAIRICRIHYESIKLIDQAQSDLEKAIESNDYDAFSQAIYGFQEALSLWDKNERAKTGKENAQFAYANCAFSNGDFDLATSLLDPEIDVHVDLLKDIERARSHEERQRHRTQLIFKTFQFLVVFTVISLTVAFIWIKNEKEKAVVARKAELVQRQHAEQEKERAIIAEKIAQKEKEKAIHAQLAERKQRHYAEQQRKIAEIERKRAEEEKEKAIRAGIAEQQQRDKVEYAKLAVSEARLSITEQRIKTHRERAKANRANRQNLEARYIAKLLLINSEIENGTIEKAASLLMTCPASLRNWEWGRLHYLIRDNKLDLYGQKTSIRYADFSLDNATIITAGNTGDILLHDTSNGKLISKFTGISGHAIYLKFLKNGQHFIGGFDDGGVYLWDSLSGRITQTIKQNGNKVSVLSIMEEKSLGLSGGGNGQGILWDVKTGRNLVTFDLLGDSVSASDISSDGQYILLGTMRGHLRVWQHQSIMKPVDMKFNATTVETDWGVGIINRYSDLIEGSISDISANIPSAGGDFKMVYPDIAPEDSELLNIKVKNSITQAVFSPNGVHIAIADSQGILSMWDSLNRFEVFNIVAHKGKINSISYSTDGTFLISGGRDGDVKIWDMKKGQLKRQISVSDVPVSLVKFASNGSQILVSYENREVHLYDIERKQKIDYLIGHRDPVTTVHFIDKNRKIITGDKTGRINVWDVKSGETLISISAHLHRITTIFTSDDEKMMFSVSSDRTVKMFRIETGENMISLFSENDIQKSLIPQKIRFYLIENQAIIRMAWNQMDRGIEIENSPLFSNNNQLAMTKQSQGDLSIWDTLTGEELFVLSSHPHKITSATFSPDNTRILTGSAEGIGKLWSVETGLEMLKLEGHNHPIVFVGFSPDGRVILTGDSSGVSTVWHADKWN